jgi:hypothetical protein
METREIQKPAFRRQSPLALAVLLLSLTGCKADDSDVASKLRIDFEDSQFCEQYACRAEGEQPLRRGGLRRAYRIRDDDSVLIQLETWGTELFTASIGLYGEEKLRPDFLELATEFLAAAIPDCRFSLKSDLPRRLSALMEARPHRCGPWEGRAGRVGSDFLITAER